MRLSPGVARAAFLAVFIVAPVIFLWTLPGTITAAGSGVLVYALAVVFGAVTLALLCLTVVAVVVRSLRHSTGTASARREVDLFAATSAAAIATVSLLIGVVRWPLALAYLVVVAAYTAVWIPARVRRLRFRAAVVVRCTPQQAFDLVSDPNHWSRYWPNLSLRRPVPVPVHVGDVIYDRVTTGGLTLDAEERVTDYVPNQSFGTRVVGGRTSRGVYELTSVAGGTEIAYVYMATLRLTESWLGAGLSRAMLQDRLLRNRQASLERIKRLLEEQPAATV